MAPPFPPFATLARAARPVLIVVLCGTLLLLGALGLRIQSALVSLRSEATDNLYWNLSQLEVDLVRLSEEIRVNVADPAAPLDELRRRHDLFYSRAQNVIHGNGLTRAGLEDLSQSLGRNLEAYLASETPLIDGPDAVLRQNLPAMAGRLVQLREDIRQTSIRLIERLARLSDERRAAVALLVQQMALAMATTIGLLISLLALVILLNRAAIREGRMTVQMSRQLKATVDSALDAIVVVDDHGRIIQFNASAESTFGYARDEVMGHPASGLLIAEDLIAEADGGGAARLGGMDDLRLVDAGRFQTQALHRTGRAFPIELSISSAEGDEGRIFIAFLRDISARRAAETALTRARDEALAAEKTKTEFLAVMSHEMRTPLNGVIASLEIASRKASDPEQARFIALAQESANLLLRHANDVLDITRMEGGGMRFAAESFDLQSHLSDLVEMVRPICTERGIALDFQMLTPSARLCGDPFRLGQIVQNFLSNAIKFVGQGRITVEAEANPLEDGRREVEIRVIDTGPGIALADQERIFQDFVMLDPSFHRAGGGAGLGLAISRRLAEAMGGALGVESEPGQGSCFWLRLPLPLAAVQAAAEPLQPGGPALPAQDILVVEDNATNRAVLEEMLRHLGQRIVLASDGAKGAAEAAARRYDLILMDISMPVMDGLEATRLIRADGASRAARIVAVTAHSLPGDLDRFRAAGMDDVLVKPLSHAALRQILVGRALPEDRPEAMLLDRGRISDLKIAVGAETFARLAQGFLRDAEAQAQRVVQEAGQPGTDADLAAICHEASGVAAVFGAQKLQAHLSGAERALRDGQGQAARARLIAETLPLWAQTRAAVADLL
ncbi:ATP-binding protein [Xinfangfangia pollutisoli]|uniref:ATP-binding protein n=1 Tax=Xinfangfangia pollutisoli TaxID=2865960 RepID=UPI001CD51654|nr:ATP-binding protein [Xinfangfangia pollutisoli]